VISAQVSQRPHAQLIAAAGNLRSYHRTAANRFYGTDSTDLATTEDLQYFSPQGWLRFLIRMHREREFGSSRFYYFYNLDRNMRIKYSQ
jgi:hypothetical protein